MKLVSYVDPLQPKPPQYIYITTLSLQYKKFINKSPEVIKASGYNLLCTRCKIEIDVSESKEQTVTEPAGAVPSSTGLK